MADITVAVKSLVKEINHKAISLADKSLNIMRNSALEVLSKNGTGRVYKRGGRIQVASAPGQPPAPDYGNLRKNWRQRKDVSGSLRIRLKLRSKQEYYRYLNEGTSRMAQRPIEKPIKKDALPKIEALYLSL